MKPVAHVEEIWRYPVKSMGGEQIESGAFTQQGLTGDRLWAVLDADGEIKSARQWPRLVSMVARYNDVSLIQENLFDDTVPDVTISIPQANEVCSRMPDTDKQLGHFLQQECRLEALQPPCHREFYTPRKERNLEDLNVELDKLEDEGDFDFSQTPEELFEVLGQYITPPGTFFDMFSLHMLSKQSLQHLGDASAADADRRRFRPNLLLDFADSTTVGPESTLVGKRIRIGEVIIHVRAKTIRCSIPARAQPLQGLDEDPHMTRAMVSLFERHVGVYANIESGGEIKVGDAVFVNES